MKGESTAAFFIVVVIVCASVGVVTLNEGLPPAYTEPTSTSTLTIPCPTSNATQTSENSTAESQNYGPLLGNLSAITIVEQGSSSAGASIITGSLLVLNRTFTGPTPEYLVNVTIGEVGLNISEVSISNGYTSTTTVSSTQEQTAWELGLVVPNGTMISVEGWNGSSAVFSQTSSFPLTSFSFLSAWNFSSPSTMLHKVNSTVATIGSNRMVVSNYDSPSRTLLEVQQGCGSTPPSTSTVATVYDATFQAGQVPGTHLTLVTQLSERLLVPASSSSPPGPLNWSVTAKVTSFTIA